MKSFKSTLKRIGIISLSLLLTFTSIPVHAETEGDNGQNGVNSGNTSSFKGGWSNNRQGYRFYIINGDKKRVSKVVDFTFEDPTGVDMNKWFTNARWESPSTTKDKSQYRRYSIDDLVKFCTIPDENGQQKTAVKASDIKTIYPMKIKEAVYGSKFQEWFIGKPGEGSKNVGSDGHRGNSGSTSGGSNPLPESEERVVDGLHIKDDEIIKIDNMPDITLKNYANYGRDDLDTYGKAAANRFNKDVTDIFIKQYKLYAKNYPNSSKVMLLQASAKDAWNEYYNDIRDCISNYCREDGCRPTSSDMDEVKKSLSYIISKNYYIYLNNSGLSALNISDIIITNQTDILKINIPLANSADKPLYPADAILQMADLKVYGFNKEVDGEEGITALDALAYTIDGVYQYYLVVEPLAWINVYTSSTKYESTRTYGSYYNIVEYMYHNVKSNNRASGAHYSYIQMYGKNSLVVKRSFNNPTLDTLTLNPGQNEDYMDVESVYKAMSGKDENGNNNKYYGYGMQIYTGKGETKPHTRTHDPKNPTSPAPAPDDTALLENPADGVKIVKYYEKNNTTVGKYTRTPAPKVIQIDDEKDTTGYALRDWFITSSGDINAAAVNTAAVACRQSH